MYDHRYFILLTLALNCGDAFNFDQLAAHMPFMTCTTHLRAQWHSAQQKSSALDFVKTEGEYLRLDPKASETKFILSNIARLEEIAQLRLFPSYMNLFQPYLRYWDGQSRRSRRLVYDTDQAVFVDPRTQTYIYAAPIQFEYSLQLPSEDSSAAIGDSIFVDQIFLSRKYSPALKFLHVQEAFSPSDIKAALALKVTLVTHHDMRRFLNNYITPEHAPTLREWMLLLTQRGLASLTVLDILRERRRLELKNAGS